MTKEGPFKHRTHVEGLALPWAEEDATVVHHHVIRGFFRNPEGFYHDTLERARRDQGERVWDRTRKNSSKQSDVVWLLPEVHLELYQRLERRLLPVIKERFGLDVTYWHTARLLRYPEGRGQHKLHTDYVGPDLAKVAFSVPLITPSRGGKLSLLMDYDVELEAGDLIVFPAYEPHEVTKVTRGTRVSLTGWLGGPRLR